MDRAWALTKHAERVIRERGVELEWIERAISSPQRVEKDRADIALKHHLITVPEHGGRVLRVVVNRAVSPARVITAYFDRNMRRKL